MKAIDRLNQLKQQAQDSAHSELFISLTNPKNILLMETLVAWTCSNVSFDFEAQIPEDTSLKDLWKLSKIDTREFANTAGLGVTDAISKLNQMKNLNLIFPDGTAMTKAITIIRMYVKSKIQDL